MIKKEDINEIDPPWCPICKATMAENHSKTWAGRSWQYHKIVFVCNKERSHYLKFEALSVEEYKRFISEVWHLG